MPKELLKDFIGKECVIVLINEATIEIKGKLIDCEGYWIKVLEKDTYRVVNGALIREIKIVE